METPAEIILVDKPKGITSFDVIRMLRRKFGATPKSPLWKMGHAGTLDPNATGLMLVGVAGGTKKLATLIGLSKTYEAEVLFGVKTDTGDTDGKILEENKIPVVESALREALASMVGTLALAVPAYAAVKQGGEALYKKARRGEVVVPPVKDMRVARAELVRVEQEGGNTIAHIIFDVGSGTYIRSLAEELARRLGTIATLKNLRRTRIGDFDIKDAIKLIN